MKYLNLADMFFSKRDQLGDHTAYKYKKDDEWKSISFLDATQTAEKIAAGMTKFGIGRGDRIALISNNRWEWVLTDYATLALGACTVPIYPTLSAEQTNYILQDSGVKLVIVEDELQMEKLHTIANKLPPAIANYYVIDPGDKNPGNIWQPFDKIISAGEGLLKDDPGFIQNEIKKTNLNDVASIIYTSGTTGEPKGAIITHRNFLFNIEGVSTLIDCGPDDVDLAFLPLSHALERTAGHFFMCYHGATMAIAQSLDTVAQDIQDIKPTLMVSVPRLYEKMYSRILETVESGSSVKRKIFHWAGHNGREYRRRLRLKQPASPFLKFKYLIANRLVFSKLKEKMGGRLRFFVSGGAPLSAEIGEFFDAAGIIILEGYGLTETAPGISFNSPDSYKFGSVGTPLPGVEVKIAADGEILARGDNIMRGYLNKEAETKEAIDPDGWFHTGDIGIFDEDGHLVITDRKKNIIVTSGGKNVAPQPIENNVMNSQYIEQAVVLGERRRFCSAVIVPAREALLNWANRENITHAEYQDLLKDSRVYAFIEQEIDRLTQNFANFERIKKFFMLPDPFTQEAGELTPTLKVKRKVVEEKYGREIEEIYDMSKA